MMVCLVSMMLVMIAANAAPAPVSTAATSAPATSATTAPTIRQADQLAMTGHYDEALALYERIAGEDAARNLDAAIGTAAVLELTGRYAEGLERLEAVRAGGQDVAGWHLARARLLEATGLYDQAVQACQSAIAIDGGLYEVRYRLARLYETTGRLDRALRAYSFFEGLAHERVPDRADQLVWHAQGFYRYSVLTSHPGLAERTRYVLHELLQPAYEIKDPQYWPARVASGELLLAKYNVREAEEDFKAALKINPHLPAAEAGLAAIALEAWQFEQCEQHIQQALKVNPNHVPTLNVLTRLRLTERKYFQAAKEAERPLKVNPNDLEALSLAAAAQIQLGHEPVARQYEDRVRKINPRCALLDHTVAEWLSAARQFPQAEQRYLKAIEVDPSWSDPQAGLGLMYMQWGDEAKARTILNRAWRLDPFNAKTFNVRQLLEQIDGFQRIESDHFTIKLDANQDSVLGPYFVDYLASIWPELCRDYGYTSPEKVIVEVFPSHLGFSVRITSRPWIHTIGACTGRVIAMDAPRRGASMTGPFDWARVLRHELTHTVTLGATDNRIPHWFTEGLAVRQEAAPRTLRWMELLSRTVRQGRLIKLEDLDWSFIRPRRADERELAYAQSEWIVEFLVAQYGHSSIKKMLALFKERKLQPDVIRAVCGVDPDGFYEGFRRWAMDQVRTWGLPAEPIPPVEQLQTAVSQRPTDAAPLAALAEALLYDGKVKEANEAAKKALNLNDRHVLALTVRCTILMEQWRALRGKARRELAAEAEPLLNRLADVDAASAVAPRYLALLAMGREDLDAAAPWLERLRRVSPHDPVASQGLAALYLKQGKPAEAMAELSALAAVNEHDADLPRKIADLCLEQGRDEEAARWLVRAIQIDPYHVETHEQLASLSLKSGQVDQAIREYEALTTLEPAKPEHFTRLSACYRKKGRLDQAQAAAKRAAELKQR
jgi:tetratricopeptide (TPR) repeat protein